MVRVEHHVFIEAERHHLHAISFQIPDDMFSFARESTSGPHQLLADHAALSRTSKDSRASYVTRTLDELESEIAQWFNQRALVAVLERLPDITASAALLNVAGRL